MEWRRVGGLQPTPTLLRGSEQTVLHTKHVPVVHFKICLNFLYLCEASESEYKVLHVDTAIVQMYYIPNTGPCGVLESYGMLQFCGGGVTKEMDVYRALF
ncbi:hypothetical protein KC19_VG084000 [Ceratodon purpureus]|uniref:Uncharacterized protein n=1 Tax=Ceratodon purpureus TaxID=3225 RepID=A0A8T0HNT2_CERPU|nr:hypothetical protein KC19_VG084000 [Ceratodon purpureus]